jgi:trk system potassium uptake protein
VKVIVIGCGRIGSELAYRLSTNGHDVDIIDKQPSAFDKLPLDFQGRIHEGDAMSQDVLNRAGIEKAEAMAVVTSSDAVNLVVSQVARSVYHVPRVVTRNFEPRYRRLYEVFNVQVISATSWGAQRLEEVIIHSEVRTIFSAGNGEISIYELIIPMEWEGKKISDLIGCESCNVVALTRGGKAFLPEPGTILKDGDIVHVSTTTESVEAMRSRIHQSRQEK